MHWMRLSIIIAVISLTFNSLMATFLWLNPAESSYVVNLCYGLSDGYTPILYDYQGNVAIMENGQKLVILISMSLHLTEAIIYLVIFHHCYKHDKSMIQILGHQVSILSIWVILHTTYT